MEIAVFNQKNPTLSSIFSGLCEPSICEKVEPLYADKLYCGHKAQMEIPSNGTVWFITMSCSYCGDPEEEDMLFSTNDVRQCFKIGFSWSLCICYNQQDDETENINI